METDEWSDCNLLEQLCDACGSPAPPGSVLHTTFSMILSRHVDIDTPVAVLDNDSHDNDPQDDDGDDDDDDDDDDDGEFSNKNGMHASDNLPVAAAATSPAAAGGGSPLPKYSDEMLLNYAGILEGIYPSIPSLHLAAV